MTFTDAVATCFKKFADFSGRARRSEYWKFILFTLGVEILARTIFTAIIPLTIELGGTEVSLVYLAACLIFLLPKIAVSVRRLHDLGKSGWFYLLNFIPFVGPIILFVFFVKDSEPSNNKYGQNPKELRPTMQFQNA